MMRTSSVALSIATAIALAGVTTSGTAGSSMTSNSANSPSPTSLSPGRWPAARKWSNPSTLCVFTLTNKCPKPVDPSADMFIAEVQERHGGRSAVHVPRPAKFQRRHPVLRVLGVRQSARMTLIVHPFTDVTDVRLNVRVCSSNESGIPNPVSTNDRTTIGVRC